MDREHWGRWLRIALPLVVALAIIPPVAFLGGAQLPLDPAFSSWAHSLHSPGLTTVMQLFSYVAYHPIQSWLVGAVAVYALRRRRAWLAPVVLLAARWGSYWLGDLLKDLYARPRPALDWVASQSTSYSYPSGSVVIGASFYIMLAHVIAAELPTLRLQRAARAAGWTVGGLIAFSRIYLGAHWLTDTVAGLLVAGSLTSALGLMIRSRTPRVPLSRLRAVVPAAAARMRDSD